MNKLKLFLKNPLTANVLYLAILQGFNYLLPFVALPFLFIKLGVKGYGLIAFAYSTILFLNILVDFGFDLYSTREISIHRDNKSIVDKIFSETMVSKLLILIISFLILIFLTFTVNEFKENKTIFFLMFFVVIGNCLSPLWYFQGIEKMKYVTLINGFSKIASFLPMFIFIKSSDDLILAALFYGLGYFISGVLSLFIAFYSFKVTFTFTNFNSIKKNLINSSHFFLSRATVSFYTTCNTMIIGLTLGNEMTGYYNVAEKIYQAFTSLISPLTQGLYPYIAKTKNVILFKKILQYSIIGSLLIVSFIFVFSEGIIEMLFNTRNDYSTNVLKILIIGGVAITPSYLLGYPFLAAMGYTKYTNNTVVIVGVNHLIWLVLLYYTSNINIYSISILIVVSEFFALILRFYGVMKFKLFK